MTVSRTPVMGCFLSGMGLFFLLSYSGSVSRNGNTALSNFGLLLIIGLFVLVAHLYSFRLIYVVGKDEIKVTEWSLLRAKKVKRIAINQLQSIRVGYQDVYVGHGNTTRGTKLIADLKDGTTVELTDPMYDDKTLAAIERFVMVRSGKWEV